MPFNLDNSIIKAKSRREMDSMSEMDYLNNFWNTFLILFI